jgi:hypothetical protein
MSKPRAVLVAVDYTDLLTLTLPYNREHFSEVLVVTDTKSSLDVERLCQVHGCQRFTTDSFYDGGASFNKWKALEQGLDWIGREGWLCLMDADILIPKTAEIRLVDPETIYATKPEYSKYCRPGYLYGALRHMQEDVKSIWPHSRSKPAIVYDDFLNPDISKPQYEYLPYPPEKDWPSLPIHRNTTEWAGYFQLFHAEDPHLGSAPWHEINWRHAGGADSFFQQKWPTSHKIRFPWNVLHLGEAGQNWYGRATPYLDGTTPEHAEERSASVRNIWASRRGRSGPTRFDPEKL